MQFSFQLVLIKNAAIALQFANLSPSGEIYLPLMQKQNSANSIFEKSC